MKQSLKFITSLSTNNNKAWFDVHKKEYLQAKEEVTQLVDKLIKQIVKFDPAIAGTEAAKTLFRINRDIRFSKDKSPYKTNFGASMNPGGKKEMSAGYYIHIEPGKSFLAGGCYMPPSDYLQAIRQEIDYNGKEFRKIISAKDFKEYFLQLNQDDTLKTIPKGFEKDHPDADLLKLKSYIVVHNFSDKQLCADDFEKHAAKVFKAMLPLNVFLRAANP